MMLLSPARSAKLALIRASTNQTLLLLTDSGRNPPIPAWLGVPAPCSAHWKPKVGLTTSWRRMLIASPRSSALLSCAFKGSGAMATAEPSNPIERRRSMDQASVGAWCRALPGCALCRYPTEMTTMAADHRSLTLEVVSICADLWGVLLALL